MRWLMWWQFLIALQAHTIAQSITPTICEEDGCRCDSFTRVICNCTREFDDITLRPDGAYRVPSMATGIIIDGCSRVTFLQETVRNLYHLRVIEVRNVQNVYISERSLAWSPFSTESEMNPGLRLLVRNSTVIEIASHAVQGRYDDIVISDSKINVIKPFAFSSLTGVKNIELTDNTFDNIEIQVFKKFTTVNFMLRGGVINALPSRFLSDMEVTNLFRMDRVHVRIINSLTFLVSLPKRVLIENNYIELLEGEGFHISTRGPVTFRNNTVRVLRKGAFLGFTVQPETLSVLGPQELLIDNNTISELSIAALTVNRTTLRSRVDGLNVNTSCVCALGDEWRLFVQEQGATINCWYTLEDHYVSLPTFIDSRCGAFKQNFWIFIVIGVVLVLIVAALITYFIVKRDKEQKKKLQIVLPDGKTYRETEFHIVVERAELLTTDL